MWSKGRLTNHVFSRKIRNKLFYMEKKRIRLAKVHGRSQEVHNLYGDGRSGYRAVPWLRMGGLWMEKLGFKLGDPA
jgi:hypothetical protein